eukprot:TRINITY_DN63933_c0_g1_i1.p1 TRINITY_DN63933_c0_g1~~TRINITY_DN63933_c0_g1_i1.p1  ORF type:complete len:230 (-),score=50.47 TRINITY_DN63933_c0_g1_i1:57-722(-)
MEYRPCCAFALAVLSLGGMTWPCHGQPTAPSPPGVANFTTSMVERIKQMEDGTISNNFCWGEGLPPQGRTDWRSLMGKVAGCILHKAELIALQWDIAANRGRGGGASPPLFYRRLCTSMASCCSILADEKGDCVGRLSTTYSQLVKMAEAADADTTRKMDQSNELASVFASLTQVSSHFFGQVKEGYSGKAEMVMNTCQGSPASCTAADLDRLRQELQAKK